MKKYLSLIGVLLVCTTVNAQDINIRINKGNVQQLLEGTWNSTKELVRARAAQKLADDGYRGIVELRDNPGLGFSNGGTNQINFSSYFKALWIRVYFDVLFTDIQADFNIYINLTGSATYNASTKQVVFQNLHATYSAVGSNILGVLANALMSLLEGLHLIDDPLYGAFNLAAINYDAPLTAIDPWLMFASLSFDGTSFVLGFNVYVPPVASISGPSQVSYVDKGVSPVTYTWTASVSAGRPPFTYTWWRTSYGSTYQVGTGTSYSETYGYGGYCPGCNSNFTLTLNVTDAANQTATATRDVTIYWPGGGDEIAGRFSGEAEQAPPLPTEFDIEQNYPNPFNPETVVSFSLPEASEVRLEVFDVLGRTVATLAEKQYGAGSYQLRWNGIDNAGQKVNSGTYFYRLDANGESGRKFSKVMKMLLAK